MVAKLVSVNAETNTFKYAWKMYTLQTIPAFKKPGKQLRVKIKLFVNARMLKALTSHERSWISFIQHFCSFFPFIEKLCIFYRPDITVRNL